MRLAEAGACAVTAALVSSLALALAPPSPRRLVLASRDPALRSALTAAFAPRGVEVVESAEPLRRTTDGAGSADAVWLCEPDSGGTALCVRPRRGRVIVRRISMPTPLSAADAAALTLSVQVALMPDETAPPATRADLAAQPTPPAHTRSDGHRLTVEAFGGARSSTAGAALRGGIDAVYTPQALAGRVGLGLGLGAGPAAASALPSARGPGPAPPGGTASDLTVRLFARGRLALSSTPACRHCLWLELDVGPAAHVLGRDAAGSPDPGRAITDRWLRLSADGALGVIVPFGRYFAGARAGGFYLVTGPSRDGAGLPAGVWTGEAVLTFGAGFL